MWNASIPCQGAHRRSLTLLLRKVVKEVEELGDMPGTVSVGLIVAG